MSIGDATAAPPFWELESLIAAGCDLSEALLVLSSRRDFQAASVGGQRRRTGFRSASHATMSRAAMV